VPDDVAVGVEQTPDWDREVGQRLPPAGLAQQVLRPEHRLLVVVLAVRQGHWS
jgi:hypothetical protein